MEDINVNDQILDVETKMNNKLKEYISRNDLTHEDNIDVFEKIDNAQHILSLEFEYKDVNENGLVDNASIKGSEDDWVAYMPNVELNTAEKFISTIWPY